MPSYKVALTTSAARELQKLPHQLVTRIFPRIERLAGNPRPPGCKKCRVATASGASASATIVWCTPSTTQLCSSK